jgi:hypothetical protein
MRKLVLARIVHTGADMGSMKEGLAKEGMEKIGKERWLENERKIEKFWEDTEKEIDGLGLDYSKLRVYQDGLPAGGQMGAHIVSETAKKGSKNYLIIKNLMERGATIEATESPQLLMKEYDHIKAIISAKTPAEKADAILRYDAVKDELMRDRDTYIAGRIDDTLKDGETGLLFIGASHDIRSKLPPDIEVKSMD